MSRWLQSYLLGTCKLELHELAESSLDSKEIKPVNLKGDNHEYSLEGLMLKLKLEYFGYLI